MCGRYTVFTDDEDDLMHKFLHQAGFNEPLSDIAPTDAAPIITLFDGKIRSKYAFWGLPAPKQPGKTVYNARSETATVKNFFKEAVFNRRCVIPAVGFYERSRQTGQNYLFTPRYSDILYMAGAYNEYGSIKRFVIFTRDADSDMADVHNRQPVMMRQDEVRAYLTEYYYFNNVFVEAPPKINRTFAG